MDKKISKMYKNVYNANIAELIRLAKESDAGEYHTLIRYFIQYLKFMRDTFELRELEFAENDGNKPIIDVDNNLERLQNVKMLMTIKAALTSYDDYLNTSGKYASVKSQRQHDGSYKVTITSLIDDVSSNDALIKEKEEKEKHWNDFWNCIKNNIRDWWY